MKYEWAVIIKQGMEGSRSEIACPGPPGLTHSQQVMHQEPQGPSVDQAAQSEPNQANSAARVDGSSSKKALLGLMLEVRLVQMGYSADMISGFSQREIERVMATRQIQPTQLSHVVRELVSGFMWQHVEEERRFGLRFGMGNLSDRSNQRESGEGRPTQVHLPLSQNVQKPVRVIQTESIMCSICYSPSQHFSQLSCDHLFCDDCLEGYVRESMRAGTFNIACPQQGCPQELSIKTVKKLLSDKEYERYKYFNEKNRRELDPRNKFCSTPDCGQILQQQGDSLRCDKCGINFCQICMQQAHGGKQCDEAIKKIIEKTYSQYKIKKCPKCSSPIQRSVGCNHMTCKKCNYQFCWVCLSSISPHHYKFYNFLGCPNMQFADQDELLSSRLKVGFIYLALPLLLALGLFFYLTAVVLYMIIELIYKPLEWIEESEVFCQKKIVKVCCACTCEGFQNLLMWFLLQPRAILYAVFWTPVKMTKMFCGSICRMFE